MITKKVTINNQLLRNSVSDVGLLRLAPLAQDRPFDEDLSTRSSTALGRYGDRNRSDHVSLL